MYAMNLDIPNRLTYSFSHIVYMETYSGSVIVLIYLKVVLECPKSIVEAVSTAQAAWWDPEVLEDASIGLLVDSFPH